ncbi:MAG: class I SAM-dependent methyltransferase [Nitrospirae bacterium]|nr:class I SAM-dependent methyltransferase [Nitrospirota bacterium]
MASAPTDHRTDLVERFFRGTGSTYDFMVHAATFGIDRLWKRRMVRIVRERVGTPRAILDLACGTGLSTFAFARANPNCRIVGVELRDEYLQRARAKCRGGRYPNVEFVLSRAEAFETTERFDVVSGSYLAKYADLPPLVEQLVGAQHAVPLLVPGGLFMMHDFTLPPHRAALAVWRAYFWLLQTIGSRLFPSWKAIYEGLPELIQRTRWTSELTALLRERGFQDVTFEWQTLWGSAIVTARSPRR